MTAHIHRVNSGKWVRSITRATKQEVEQAASEYLSGFYVWYWA